MKDKIQFNIDWEIEVSRLHYDSLTCILFYPHVFHLVTTLGVLELALFVNDRSISAVIDIDFVGTFTMCHEALKYLKKGGPGKSPSTGGIIINISATLHYTATWYQIHVSATKAVVDSITRSLALEWGTDYDIRVNGIAPGPIDDTAGLSKLAPEDVVRKAKEHEPLFKLREKWDIVMAAVYLASKSLSM
ncbi:Peroxisomal 2,4-dienoyl-CoA reductase [Vitis vinifera]|uniref:2,4-dienoyl-CoA reductase [(3E)-enoyl-CoA-producing] n=3 Tax=Vitis vinifera TaxID=29760 RepID=A0A438KB25_VITVI|nr:Peroxisomal 2,4-dienoyl-CoA reductase [Vitis vinifera]